MSPLALRRYRAERLLRREFEEQRGKVLAIVRARLRTHGLALDDGDLEECYALAWQGLYATVLAGEEVANATGWLALVCFRRAIDECRSRRSERERLEGDAVVWEGVVEPDLARELDDRARLRQTFEGLRARLHGREREAATLCYVQGLSRSEAARRMGISEARMRKLMDGAGPARPGVAGKVSELLASIRAGGFCEEQSSLMRGLAFGVLDPDGERYRLAQLHRRECPACRAYVLSLRGLAAVLPPLRLPTGAGAGVGAATGAGAGAGAGGGARAVAKTGVGMGGGTGPSSALWGGSVLSPLAKLAVGCVLIAGAGGLALAGDGARHGRATRARGARATVGAARAAEARGSVVTGNGRAAGAPDSRRRPVAPRSSPSSPAARVGSDPTAARASGRASREFSLEQRDLARPAVTAPSAGSPVGAAREFGVR